MRILHISETDYEGGAGKAAHAVHLALRQKGVESFFLAECAQSDDPFTETFSGFRGLPAKILRRIRAAFDLLPLRRYPRRQGAAWSVGWVPRSLERTLSRLQPDIIHLHWISQALPVRTIGRLPVQVVWTHHDWGAFTGGCRCPVDCRRFVSGCGSCPLLNSSEANDLSHRTCLHKQNFWRATRIHSVAVGTGIANDVRKSLLLGTRPCTVIPNGIDTDCFHPLDRRQARITLGLDPQDFVILFGAFSLDTPLKGGQELLEALTCWRQRHPEVKACVATVGLGRVPEMPSGMQMKALGFLPSPKEMATAYNAADVVVVPSRIESFGLMAAEAQACGVPVVAFEGTGVRDIVQHLHTGFLAPGWSAEGLAQGIDWAHSLSNAERTQVSDRARQNASTQFSLSTVADAHLALYHSIIEGNGTHLAL